MAVVFVAAAALMVSSAGSHAVAVAASLVAKPDKTGLLKLSSGAHSVQVDLRKDVPGCIGELFDPTTGKRLRAGDVLRVLDITDHDGRSYVLLTAVASPNCNVQGMCGAASVPNVTLIWLKVSPELKVEAKQTAVVEDCATARSVEGLPDDYAQQLRIDNDRLLIAFQEDRPDGRSVTGKVEYDRRSPEAGLKVSGLR